MRWLWDGFAGLWNGLLGRARVPRDHDQLWRHGEQQGGELGRLESARGGGGASAPVEPAPTEAVIRGVVDARIASLSQRFARRYNRLRARGKKWQRRGERRTGRAATLREARPDVEPKGRAIEPFVARTLAYLASFGIVVLILEAAGMWTSLEAFEGMVGWLRTPLSLAAGAVLALAGHTVGHLLFSAVEERTLRPALISGALAVVVIGALAVIWLGVGRDANLRATDRFAQVGKLEEVASKFEREAGDLLRPTAEEIGGEAVPEPSAADRRAARQLEKRAQGLRAEAAEAEATAREERTLDFFALIQILGLAVGAVGGFYFAAAAQVREFKRLTGKAGREDRRASRRYSRAGRAHAKADDVADRVGRVVLEETAWGRADLGHFQETRLLARGVAVDSPSPQPLSKEQLQEAVERAIGPADLNGANPVGVTDSKGGK